MDLRRRESLGLLCLFLHLSLLNLSDARISRQVIRYAGRTAMTDPPFCVHYPLTPGEPIVATRPPAFLPPILYPPPLPPPPPTHEWTLPGLWCVAKPTVPDPIIQEAMNYACGSGADCRAIEPGGSCYQPDTLIAHASFAFNSYWQRTKVAGGTCDFEGTALLITSDPSYGGCYFNIY